MKKLPAVEESRAVMTQGLEWGVFKWLMEKRRVRQIADRATAALNEAEDNVKAEWSDELVDAYNQLVDLEEADPSEAHPRGKRKLQKIDPEVAATAKRIKEADDETERVRLDAEATFEEAEKRMSVSLTREGARKALQTYDLHEKAIRKAEAATRNSKTTA
jgi:hypothetical protein